MYLFYIIFSCTVEGQQAKCYQQLNCLFTQLKCTFNFFLYGTFWTRYYNLSVYWCVCTLCVINEHFVAAKLKWCIQGVGMCAPLKNSEYLEMMVKITNFMRFLAYNQHSHMILACTLPKIKRSGTTTALPLNFHKNSMKWKL